MAVTFDSSIIKKIFKIVAWTLGIILLLLLAVILAIRIPAVQNYVVDKVTTFVASKTKTRITIDSIFLGFPSTVIVEGIFLDDLNRDTLLYAEKISAGLGIFGLLSGDISLGDVSLEKVKVNLNRNNADSTFNFNFLITAFAPDSSGSVRKKDTLSKPVNLSVDEIKLSDITLNYRDDVSGFLLNAHIGKGDLPVNDIDIDSLDFETGNVALSNGVIDFVQFRNVASDTLETKSVSPRVTAASVSLSNIAFHMSNSQDSTDLYLKSGEITLSEGEFNMKNHRIAANEINLDRSSFMLFDRQTGDISEIHSQKTAGKTPFEIPFSIRVEKVAVKQSVFALKQTSHGKKQGFDSQNLALSINRFNVEEIYHDHGNAGLIIKQTVISDRSGLAIKKLEGIFKMKPEGASVSRLVVATGESEVNGTVNLKYRDFQEFIDNPADAAMMVNLNNTVIAINDLIRLNEELLKEDIIRKNRYRKFVVNLEANGKMEKISIKKLNLSTTHSTNIQLSGTVNGLPDVEKLIMNIAVNRLTTTATDIRSFVIVPANVQIPENITLTGNYNGSIQTFSYDFIAGTNRGSVTARGSFENINAAEPAYTLTAVIKKLDVGFILKNPALGETDLSASVNGKGFDVKTMINKFDVVAEKFTYGNYGYQDIEVQGAFNSGEAAVSVAVGDLNLDLEMEASVGFLEKEEYYKAEIKLLGIDMEALKLSDHALRASGTGLIDLEGNKMNNLKGFISVKDVLIVKRGKDYPIENLAVIKFNENNTRSVSLESSLLSATFNGSISIDETFSELRNFVNHYFSTDSIPLDNISSSQTFDFNVTVKNAPVISEVFVPGLESFIPGPINGSFDGKASKLLVTVQLPQVIYSGIRIDSLNFKIDSDTEKLMLLTSFNRMMIGNINLARTDLLVTASKNKINAGIIVSSEENVKLKMKTTITRVPGTSLFRLSINDHGIIINNENWIVPVDNYVEVGNSLPRFNDFSFSRQTQSVRIANTLGGIEGIGVSFVNFDIGIISGIIERDVSYLDGTLNGNFDLIKEKEGSGIIANVTLDKFSFRGTPVGDFVLKAKSEGRSRYQVNLKMTGNGNDLTAAGYYLADTTGGNINVDVAISKLSVKSIEPFTNGQLSRSKGYIQGDIEISGALTKPGIDGDLSFNDVGFNVTYLNNYFNLSNEKFRMDQDAIYLDAFTITDSLNHTAILNGKIEFNELTNPKFFIDLKTDRFMAMNSVPGDDKLFYGTLIISSNIKIRGDKNLPVVTSNVKLLEGSSFTFVVPEDKSISGRGEEDVTFTDPYNRVNPIMKRETELDTFKMELKGFDISSNVEITKETTLRILVDPESGDSLVIRGDATMSFSLDPSGKTSLTGGFEINEGSYRVSLQNLVKRNFEITKGSSINWRGDILDAEINIDAVNVVNAVPLELVADQVAGLTEQQLTAYRQRLPFQVILHMKGELMRPEISFEIALRPEDQGVLNGTVYAKLTLLNQDPSELNKQVFALLVLNRFVQENPLDNESGSGLTYVARNSVSKFLSQQLNIFAEQFIRGVELNFDVQSYEEYNTGNIEGRTEVNIGAKKQFFNDRLIVQVAGNVDVEGERTKQNDVSNLAGDIVLEYLLTEDGRYRLRVFRKDQYAGIIDGEVKESGMGLLYTHDFDRWNQLFKKPENSNLLDQ